MSEKKNVGRPRIPEKEKKQYQRMAVYKHTYELIVAKSKAEGLNMVDYLEKVIQ
jgi:hypothetical protein